MRLLFIRHADPDYEHDSITEKGWKEAELLTGKLEKEPIDAIYCSTMGRAKDTASLLLRSKNMEAQYCEWLREFSPRINRPDITDRKKICWDWLPQDWTCVPEHFLSGEWYKTQIMQEADAGNEYRNVTEQFDRILAKHGYVRNGLLYRADNSNRDTIAFFCHFGIECVLLSHLMNVSPMILWHHTCAAPSSVTSLYTEERRKGIVSFRMNRFGDISHLYEAGEVPSFQARFCETWDSDERHD